MAGGDSRRAAKLEEDEAEDDISMRSNSKSEIEIISSDDEEANEDLSLKVVEKALLKRAFMLAENQSSVFDDFRVGRGDVDLPSSSSQARKAVLASTSDSGVDASTDVKSRKVKKKKMKTEKVVAEKVENNVVTVEKPMSVEENNTNVMDVIQVDDSKHSFVVSQKTKVLNKHNVFDKGDENVVEVENPKPVEDENENVVKVIELVDSLESGAVNTSTNIVLQKLLRGPRYFDPPDSSWETCYNCGEEGHMAVNCASASRRKKPCFICGSLDHTVRQCSKAKDCYICKKGGHRAKDCPESFKMSKNVRICLRCGNSGHDMFSCSTEYASDDLKEIQCYLCKDFGHLCCAKYVDTSPREVSCYKCGQSGHIGTVCGKHQGQNSEIVVSDSPKVCYRCGSLRHFARECQSPFQEQNKNVTVLDSPSECYRCGKVGHFARECQSSSQVQNDGIFGMEKAEVCYRCGEEGHFARDCRSSAKVQNDGIFGTETAEVCYRCGEAGHFARECRSSAKVQNDGILGMETAEGCYRCGEAGHFARECRSSAKAIKRNREPSTSSSGRHSENEKHWRFNSAPKNHGKDSKMRRTEYENNGITTPRKSKQRGGWIHEDPEEFLDRKSIKSRWSSPRTPYEHHRASNTPFGGHFSGPHPSDRFPEHHRASNTPFGGHFSGPHPSDRFSHRHFSASRFGDPRINEVRRTNHWW